FKHFLSAGSFLAIKGRIEVPPRRSELEFSIHTIELISGMREKNAKSVHLKIEAKALEQRLISDLNKLFLENEGKCSVSFTIIDSTDNVEINMPSKSIKIDPNNKVFKTLQEYDVAF